MHISLKKKNNLTLKQHCRNKYERDQLVQISVYYKIEIWKENIDIMCIVSWCGVGKCHVKIIFFLNTLVSLWAEFRNNTQPLQPPRSKEPKFPCSIFIIEKSQCTYFTASNRLQRPINLKMLECLPPIRAWGGGLVFFISPSLFLQRSGWDGVLNVALATSNKNKIYLKIGDPFQHGVWILVL